MTDRIYKVQGLPLPEGVAYAVEDGKVVGIVPKTEAAINGYDLMHYWPLMSATDKAYIKKAIGRARRKQDYINDNKGDKE